MIRFAKRNGEPITLGSNKDKEDLCCFNSHEEMVAICHYGREPSVPESWQILLGIKNEMDKPIVQSMISSSFSSLRITNQIMELMTERDLSK
jgi:hypothetical protein